MHKFLFRYRFIIYPYMFRALCAHRQEVKIVLYSIWYHHTCRWPSGAQVARGLVPVHRTATYRCDDTRCCSTCVEHCVLIVSRSKLYYTAYGIITPVGGRPVHRLREERRESSLNRCTGRPPTGVMIPDAV